MPYSMPLCTILTKCPAPLGPHADNASAVPLFFGRPGVRATSPIPGASVLKIGSSRFTVASGPPIIMQYPRSSPIRRPTFHVDVVDALRGQFLGVADVVD